MHTLNKGIFKHGNKFTELRVSHLEKAKELLASGYIYYVEVEPVRRITSGNLSQEYRVIEATAFTKIPAAPYGNASSLDTIPVIGDIKFYSDMASLGTQTEFAELTAGEWWDFCGFFECHPRKGGTVESLIAMIEDRPKAA